jgi:hypothetical protein
METSASFEAWSAPSPYPTTARKQAVKIQLRNLTKLRCRRRLSSGRQHPGTTAIAKGVPGSPESLARGMFPKGFSHEPRRAPHLRSQER